MIIVRDAPANQTVVRDNIWRVDRQLINYLIWLRNNKIKDAACLMCKGKGKAEHLYSALRGIQTTLKRSGMDHTVLPATNTMPAFTS